MTREGLRALLSHWRRNPLQAFTLVAGLALATALWSGVQAINAEARASYDAAAATLGEGRFAQIVDSDGGEIPMDTFVELRRSGWLASPVIEGRLNGVRIVGLDPLTAPGGLGPVNLDSGTEVGTFLGGEGQVFGQTEALDAIGDLGPERVADPDVAPMTVVTDISVARELLGRDGANRLILSPDQPMGRPELSEIAPGLSLRPAQGGTDVARLTDSFHLNLTAFGFLSFAVGLFIVHGAIGLAFEQRRPMVRTLRAVGMPLNRLVWLMAVELLGISLLAGLIGVALGYVIAAALLPDVAATLSGLYGAQVSGTLELRPVWWLAGLGISVLGTAAASTAALRDIARMPILASARPRAWAMRQAGGRWLRIGGAAGLVALAAVLVAVTEGLAPSFAALGALLVGAALALPLVLDACLALAARGARSAQAEWFWADTRQQLPGLSLALMALLLAMAANVGVSTMVSSFRLTFTGFLDQRLAAELYVTAEDEAQAERITEVLSPEVRAILPVQWVERDVAGLPAEIYGNRDDATYRENWVFLEAREGAWETVFAGEGAVINEQLYRRAGLSLGDEIAVGPGTRLPVVGVVGDYGNPIGQVIVAEPLFQRLYPEVTAQRYGLRTDRPQEIRDLLREDLGLPEGQIVDQSSIKAFSLQVFERTFTVTGALNVLTLTVAGFAILMSLLTLAALRLPQLAPVWALGLTRKRLGGLEMIRAVMLALLTTLAALPLGLALAWILLARVNVAAFGWRLPMYLFPADYAVLAGFAVLAATLAALWPARRLARTPPGELLKVFSNER
ncbi:ABC transporter permease [Histidinibacterium aquaticum]|uniref:ABC transporter permease n=1 Tax=Histidinibacterium aquaticum TaxID=2613962 RepID=A0A5J5GFU7_9RHOB|nr:ABC transporter permease [Histidinibacterium aquaticum]KAA9007001.1 ABC transporter permease [Histidinibacterium aquaticum]